MLEFVELEQVSTLLEKGLGEEQGRNQSIEQKKSEPLLHKGLQQDILLIMLKLINHQQIIKRKVDTEVGMLSFELL
jgi:hypothetical protein